MSWRSAGALLIAALILHLALIQPNHPAAMTPQALLAFPLELPVVLLGLVALPPRGGATLAVRVLLVFALALIIVSKIADYATFVAFDRGFNAVVDGHLLHAAWTLASGAVGSFAAGAVLVVAVPAFLGIIAALWWASGRWARVAPRRALRGGAVVALVPAAALAVGEVGHAMRAWQLPFQPPGAAFTARVGLERVLLWDRTLADLTEFRRAAREDPMAGVERPLDLLDGRDVALIYIESYGRASIDHPPYASTHVPRLEAIGETLRQRGLAARSGWLRAPTAGGQSWLSHGTLAAGLWADNQGRYQAMIASPRRTLFDFARRAGYRTAAVMPAITMAWPEGDFFGFDEIHAAADLGYEGPAFNWVTMPDQYTLRALERRELAAGQGAERAPVFVQAALISSHAPWVPVLPVIDWDTIGDGATFERWRDAGDAPEAVWAETRRIRAQYRKAIDYSLRVVGEFAARRADRPALVVVLGDHPAAGFVSQVPGRAVPVHVIGPPELVARTEAWGWTPGMIPGEDTPVRRMDTFRDMFLRAYSSELGR